MTKRSGSWIDRKTGVEGPRHDPYGWTEVTVHRADGREATIHSGLAQWVVFSFDGYACRFEGSDASLSEYFEKNVGISPETAEKYFESKSRPIRLHPCGRSHLKSVAGYPGEHFTICGKCGDVVDSEFNLSEVE